MAATIKKIPMRMCVGCKQMFAKRELIRIVRKESGEVVVDESGKLNGRGAYICSSVKCFEKCLKSNTLSRHLESKIDEKVIEDIQRHLKQQ